LLAEYHRSRDPNASAPYGVSWAGEEKSSNWFDTAREFTERWHHQQQIRLAVNKPSIMTRELYYPVLDCFLRALPFTYRTVSAKPGTYLQINVSGECGGNWYLARAEQAWRLTEEPLGISFRKPPSRRKLLGASSLKASTVSPLCARSKSRVTPNWVSMRSE